MIKTKLQPNLGRIIRLVPGKKRLYFLFSMMLALSNLVIFNRRLMTVLSTRRDNNDVSSSNENIATTKPDEVITTAVANSSLSQQREENRRRKKVLMCAIVIDEEAYIDEWVDYHYALGFDSFHIYDNSKRFEMKKWGEKKGNHVKVTHFPGPVKQREAYLNCAAKGLEEGYTWAAFFDVDEFLQLKKHEDMVDFLEEHLSKGALGVYWHVFSPMPKEDLLFKPLPVTKRFMFRNPNDEFNKFMKSIVKLSDMDLTIAFVHVVFVKRGKTHDTNNKPATDGAEHRPYDVAVLHHYHTKSYKEYVAKRLRGDASGISSDEYESRVKEAEELYNKTFDPNHKSTDDTNELVYDDIAWEAMKKYVPKYAMYDNFE